MDGVIFSVNRNLFTLYIPPLFLKDIGPGLFMSGCPLCRFLYKNKFDSMIKYKENLFVIHIEKEHGDLGILTNNHVHCPIIGCGMIIEDPDSYQKHCEQRHYNSGGPYLCRLCEDDRLIPFLSQEGLYMHFIEYHNHNPSEHSGNINYGYSFKKTDNAFSDWEYDSLYDPVLPDSELIPKFDYR